MCDSKYRRQDKILGTYETEGFGKSFPGAFLGIEVNPIELNASTDSRTTAQIPVKDLAKSGI